MKDNPDDIPMVYVLYVFLAILAILAGAVFVIVKMLWHFRAFVHA